MHTLFHVLSFMTSIIYSLAPPPVITINPQQLINTTVGETVMFHCRAMSRGRQQNLKYFWLRVDELDKVVIDGANSDTLVISDVRHDDDGTMYQCGAANENDTTLSTVGRINGMSTLRPALGCKFRVG